MESQLQTALPLQIRFIVACPRSYSTLLMRAFLEAPERSVTNRLVLLGNYRMSEMFQPDHTILHNPAEQGVFQAAMQAGKIFLINKEDIGNYSRKDEYEYNIFPSL